MLSPAMNHVLLLLVVASGVACIAGGYRSRPIVVYVFKPTTMLLVLALAVQGETDSYRHLVLAGLAFSLAGDVFLMLPSDRFLAGLASFLVGHLFYVAAFAGDGGASGPWLALLPFAAFGIAAYVWLLPGLAGLRAPVAVYVAAIALMGGLAASRWLGVGGAGPLLAFCGACLFTLSDAVLAANRFRHPFAAAQAVILGTYFAGQCLIALSTGVGEALLGAS